MFLLFLIRCILLVGLVTAEKECDESEVKYFSTECAPDGSHFIITLPKNSSVCVVTEGPKLMKDCTQTCPMGQALNLSSNTCEDCPLGTAAPGDVYEVNYWSVLPKGFYSDVFRSSSKHSCKDFGWKPQGSYLLGTSNSYCATELTLENNNINEGSVTFRYQFTDPFLMAYFTVRNDRCVLDGGKSYILPPSSKRKWKSYTAHVPAGVSTLQWYLFPENVYDLWSVTTEFKLKSVKVTGRVSTIHCSECEPGFYANHTKSSDCEICPQNTFSGRRASWCTDCPTDEYSLPGSSSCTKRLPCVETEYTTTYSSCSADANTHYLTTELIQPVICDANSPTAPAKPRGPEGKCRACPPGTKSLNATHCVSCPTGFVSASNKDSCVACPAEEVPVFGIKYDTWSRMPPRLATYCLEEDVTCQPWRTNDSSIFVGPGLGSFVHSVLELELLDGFIGPKLNLPFYFDHFIRPLPGTKVVFDFELNCRANCTLTFAVDLPSETLIIQKWGGALERTTYTYTPGECEGASFLWIFERWNEGGSEWDPASRNDKAIIYSIAVNNTRATGALGCKKCPLGIDGQFCKPCKDGLFYTMTKNATTGVERAECVACPNGTMVIGDASAIMTVDQACIRCPPGTTSGPASECVTDLYPQAPSGQSYDFSALLTRPFTVSGSKLFTPQGHAFQQHFKLYLDTRFPSQRPTCINDNKQDRNITAWICRMTSIPEKDKLSGSESSFRSASLGLGDKLIKAVATNSSKEFAKEINAKLTTAGWKSDDLGNDYHLYFKTKSTTSACQEGINTIVTLRCGAVSDPAGGSVGTSDTALVQLPPNCVVGTCDGCQFHFMIISPLACPICRVQDYNRIEGGCVGGSMKVTLIPPKTCRSEPNFRTVFEESCPLLNTQGKIAVGVVMAIVLLLVFTIFYCYQRNKKLEYKYMKLVEGAEARVKSSFGSSSNGSDGVQQGNECGIPEDDQETDIFHHKPISAIAGGESDRKWNQLTPNSGDLKTGTFGPVIFRQNRTADDSHILTLDDGNAPDTLPI